MRQQLRQIAERIDAMTLRERVLVFAAGVGVLVLLAQALALAPIQTEQRRFAQEAARGERDLKMVAAEMQRLALGRDADAVTELRARAASLKDEIAAVDASLRGEQRRFTAPERMRQTLEDMLRRHPRLALAELKTLPAQRLIEVADPDAPAAWRHGIELALTGSFADLHRYVAALEALPARLYWRRLEFAGTYPVFTLKIVVFTVSFDRAWLLV